MYDNYVFDLYGTLVDIRTDEWTDPRVWEKLTLFMGYYGAFYTSEELQKTYVEAVAGREKTKKTELEAEPVYAHEAYPEIRIELVFQELYERRGITADEALAIHTGQFFRVLTTEYVRLYDGVPQLLEAIHAHGKKIYLLSNAQRIFTEYEMNLLGIRQYFDGILISSECGTKKPDERFFQMLIDQYQIDPKRSIMIGNDARTDIGGAKQMGMDTFYIHSNISPKEDKGVEATYCIDEMDLGRVKTLLKL